MNALRNKVQLIGNTGNNPEIRTTEAGKKYARFSMATSEKYKNNKGEYVTDTQWHNIVVWGPLVKTVEKYVVKGKEIAIEGKLINRSYAAKDGTTKYISEIQMNDLLLLNGKNK